MKNFAAFITAIFVVAFIPGCSQDLSVLGEVKGSTFYVAKSDKNDSLEAKILDLFVVELAKVGSVETKERENADFMLLADNLLGSVRINFVHRRESSLWKSRLIDPEGLGFMENARDEAAEFCDFLARKGDESKE